MGEVRLDGEKSDRLAFQARADYQNHALGWLQRGYNSLGGRKVARFPRIWMLSGECRLKVIWEMSNISVEIPEDEPVFPARSLILRVKPQTHDKTRDDRTLPFDKFHVFRRCRERQ